MMLPASSACVVNPTTVLGEMRFSFIFAMAVALAFGASLRFLEQLAYCDLFSRYVKTIANGDIGCLGCDKEKFEMSNSLRGVTIGHRLSPGRTGNGAFRDVAISDYLLERRGIITAE